MIVKSKNIKPGMTVVDRSAKELLTVEAVEVLKTVPAQYRIKFEELQEQGVYPEAYEFEILVDLLDDMTKVLTENKKNEAVKKIKEKIDFQKSQLIQEIRDLSRRLEKEADLIESGEIINSLRIIQNQSISIDTRASRISAMESCLEILTRNDIVEEPNKSSEKINIKNLKSGMKIFFPVVEGLYRIREVEYIEQQPNETYTIKFCLIDEVEHFSESNEFCLA